MLFTENKPKTVLTLRWLLIIALSYLLVFQQKSPLFFSSTDSRFFFDTLVLFYIISNISLFFVPNKIFEYKYFDLVLVVGDTVIVSGTLFLSHLSSSYLLFFYFLIILMTTLGKGLRGIITNGLILVGMYVVFQIREAGAESLIKDTGILMQVPFLLIAVIFYGVLVDQEDRRSQKTLEAVMKVSEIVSATLNLREVYKTTLDALVNLLGAEKSSIMLLDREGKVLTIQDARGIPEEIIRTARVNLGEGIAGWVAQKGQPLLLNKETRLNPDGTVRHPFPGIESAIAVPLMIQNRIIGVLNAASRSNKKIFTRQHQNLLILFASEVAVAIENARLFEEIQAKGLELKEAHLEVIMAFAESLDGRDIYTGGHAKRLSLYAEMIGRKMSFEEGKIDELKFASALHDVGKIAIPDKVLLAPGKLEPEDWEMMKTHSEKGALMISQMASLAHLSSYIRHHHERWDGNGYPDRIKGVNIPLFSRIIAVCDTYDAITTNRSYQKAFEPEEVVKILKSCRAAQLDPEVVDIFLGLILKNDGLLIFSHQPPGQTAGHPAVKILQPVTIPLKMAV